MNATWQFGRSHGGGRWVTVTVGDKDISRHYGKEGGEWKLDDGDLGEQLSGELDVQAPMAEAAFADWARKRLAEDVKDMKLDAGGKSK